MLTLLAPLPYFVSGLFDEFVVDNEEDFELEFDVERDEQPAAVQAQRQHSHDVQRSHIHRQGDYIMSNEQYNQHECEDGQEQQAETHMDAHHDVVSSRQYLRQRPYWIAVHSNNLLQLKWVLRSRQHVNLLEHNDQQ